jgi:hypothetical protein
MTKKPPIGLVAPEAEEETTITPGVEADATIPPEVAAALDDDEEEFRRLRRDLPGVKGSAAEGIVTIAVSKTPPKNEFFRSHPDFRSTVSLVNIEQGMEKQYLAVAPEMEQPLRSIGISFTDHTLYLTVTPRGTLTIVPVSCVVENDYSRTKELGLLDALKQWVRLYTDQENKAYRVYPAPEGRFADPIWPALSQARLFRLGFRDKGRLIDSTEHQMFKKWAARDQ